MQTNPRRVFRLADRVMVLSLQQHFLPHTEIGVLWRNHQQVHSLRVDRFRLADGDDGRKRSDLEEISVQFLQFRR